MTSPDHIRLMILFYRKKGMSFEDFDEYWRSTHAKVACALPIFKKNLLKYEQVGLHLVHYLLSPGSLHCLITVVDPHRQRISSIMERNES